jgi:uncharacterized membrane protein YkoI
MSGNRKIIRDQVRASLKEARKRVPKEYRDSVTFARVFNIIKDSSSNKARAVEIEKKQDVLVENFEIEPEINI